MSEARELRAKQIEEIKEKIKNSNGFILVGYKGINVNDDVALRAKCRAANIDYKVLKNRLVNKALEELGIEGFANDLQEPTAVAFANGEITAAAKVFKDTMATVSSLTIKSGYMDKAYITADTVNALASIPSKEVLIAQLLGMLQSPISGLARALQQVAEKQA